MTFSPIDSPSLEKPPQPIGIRYLFSIPIIRALCLSGSGLSFMYAPYVELLDYQTYPKFDSNTAWDVIFVLYCYSPIRTGGIAFTV